MKHKNTVIRSINLDGECICVDIFQRSDGSFGFDEFRRDPEDPDGWYNIGHYSQLAFDSGDQALASAEKSVAWLSDAL